MSTLKINLNVDDEDSSSEVYYLGISSQFKDIVMASRLNHELEIELIFWNSVKETFKNGDQVEYAMFATTPTMEEKYAPQYMMIDCNKSGYKLFNKIVQLDFLILSNKPFDSLKPSIKTILEIIYIFDLEEKNLGVKVQKLKQSFLEHIKHTTSNFFLDLDRNLFV